MKEKGRCVIYSMRVNKREAECERGNMVAKLFNVEVDDFLIRKDSTNANSTNSNELSQLSI